MCAHPNTIKGAMVGRWTPCPWEVSRSVPTICDVWIISFCCYGRDRGHWQQYFNALKTNTSRQKSKKCPKYGDGGGESREGGRGNFSPFPPPSLHTVRRDIRGFVKMPGLVRLQKKQKNINEIMVDGCRVAVIRRAKATKGPRNGDGRVSRAAV